MFRFAGSSCSAMAVGDEGSIAAGKHHAVRFLHVLSVRDYRHLMVPFTKLAYLSNLTLYNNNFLTEIRTLKSKSPANTEIKMIFHYRLIQIALHVLWQ